MYNSYNNGFYRHNTRGDDRFLGGGFVVPFVLGGIAGSLWNNNGRNNYYYYPYPYSYQIYPQYYGNPNIYY